MRKKGEEREKEGPAYPRQDQLPRGRGRLCASAILLSGEEEAGEKLARMGDPRDEQGRKADDLIAKDPTTLPA